MIVVCMGRLSVVDAPKEFIAEHVGEVLVVEMNHVEEVGGDVDGHLRARRHRDRVAVD